MQYFLCNWHILYSRTVGIIRSPWLVPNGRNLNQVFVSSLAYWSGSVSIASYMTNTWWIPWFHYLQDYQTLKSGHFDILAHWQVNIHWLDFKKIIILKDNPNCEILLDCLKYFDLKRFRFRSLRENHLGVIYLFIYFCPKFPYVSFHFL